MSVTVDEIKKKFITKLQKTGWDIPLRGFIYSKDFEDIIKFLYDESINGRKITPVLKDIFGAFEQCPYSQLKVVILGQDPYPRLGVANGVAFCCAKTREKQPSLQYLLDEVNHTVYEDASVSTNPDLSRWSKQGILLLNAALTTTVNKIGQHYLIWRPFLAYLFDILNWNTSGIVYIYMGKKALEWKDAVNDANYKFFITHPAIAHYADNVWDSDDVFNKTSKIVKNSFNYELKW